MSNNQQVPGALRAGELLWMVMFKQQLAAIAVNYGLDTWNDDQYVQCLRLLHDLGRLN